jgi:D-alanyl-D-alanine carboxypeptidase
MKELDAILIKQVDDNKTPSVQYVIFNKDSIIHSFQAGYADITKEKTVNKDTTYNAFSVTKTFTSLAVLQLAEQKRLDIEQPITKYLSDFPYSSDITVRQLLTHSAGIPNPIPLNWIHLSVEHPTFDRNEFFNQVLIKNNKTKSKPNEKFSYSNLGYVLLGQLIEKTSAMTYEQYIIDNIFTKLDLTPNDLWFAVNDIDRHAKGYHKKMSFSILILGLFIDRSKYLDKAEYNWLPFKNFYVNGSSYGGLIGTSYAFVRYIQELLKADCKLITEDYKKMLFTENHTNDHKSTGMCLSWFSGQLDNIKYYAHAGGGGGYYCEIRLYPEIGTGSVIMFNRTGMTDERFLDKVDKFIIGKH